VVEEGEKQGGTGMEEEEEEEEVVCHGLDNLKCQILKDN
jgi:hypothetical protein